VSTSSRESTEGAGWACRPGRFRELVRKRDRPLKWLSPKPLWQARNDVLARRFGDPTDDRRRAWMEALDAGEADLIVQQSEGEHASFLVLGDTGEGDASQFAVVPPLLSRREGAAFLLICSDVIYPAGGIDSYEEKFFRPYEGYDGPIYAIPGNHDWYDDATGFMFWFCGGEDEPKPSRSRPLSPEWIRDMLWRRAPKADEQAVARMRAMRESPGRRPPQRAPYLAIDAGPLRLVGIDTGIVGDIDRDQGRWLARVSRESDRPKILFTGKPIYVDGQYHPGPIEGGGCVDDIVADPAHNYIAAIGGDIHNYQRYPVHKDGRTLLYLVSGGGGAFMHETHSIPNIDTCSLEGVGEHRFRCYPLRGDSLSRFSQLYGRKLWLPRSLLFIPPDQAAAIVGERIGLAPTRASAHAVRVTMRARLAARVLYALPGRGRRGFHLPFSEWLDWNEPPMFKSFLRIDAGPDEVHIRCFAATGCAGQEDDPPVEDSLRARRADGGWEWQL
jgi:calcineurin-like phosphoesterase family protein